MRVPQIGNLGSLRLQNFDCRNRQTSPSSANSLQKGDCISFSSNTKYLKKYATLPDEIKEVISAKDSIEMFKNMEEIASYTPKRERVGQGNSSYVYDTPWLDDYCVLILLNTGDKSEVVYSTYTLGDAVWYDRDNSKIQIIKKTS